MLQRFVANEKHLYLRASINYREGWKETIYKTIGQFYRSVPSLVPLSSRKFLQIESKVVDPPIEKKSPSHRAANLQLSPVNKAGEKQIDGLRTGAARPRQGRRGRTPPFFFHRRSWKKYTVTGAHPCNPDLCSRRKREVPSKHRNSRVAFYFNVSYLASSFWLSGFRRLLFLRTRQVYNFTPRCAYSLPCDQLFSRRRCLVVSSVTCHRRDNADRRFPRRLRLAEALRFLSGVSWKMLLTCSKKLQLYMMVEIYIFCELI